MIDGMENLPETDRANRTNVELKLIPLVDAEVCGMC